MAIDKDFKIKNGLITGGDINVSKASGQSLVVVSSADTLGSARVQISANATNASQFAQYGTAAVGNFFTGIPLAGLTALFSPAVSTGLLISSNGTGPLILATNGAARMTIASTGAITLAAPTTGNNLLVLNGIASAATIVINSPAATLSPVLYAVGSTTSGVYLDFINTSGYLRIGIEGSVGGVLITGTTPYSVVLGSTTAQSLHLATNNNVRMTIDTNGNLLIGTTSAFAKFVANGNALIGNGAPDSSTAPGYSGTYFGFDAPSNTAIIQAVNTSTSQLAFHTKQTGLAPVERVRIDSVGRVGINVIPTAQLHVKGSGQIALIESTAARGAGSAYVEFKDPTGLKGFLGYGGAADDNFSIFNYLASSLLFGTSNLIRMQITGGGDIGIGGIPSGARLDVYGAVKVRDQDFISLSAVGGEFRIGWAAFTGTQVWNIFAQNSQALAFGTAGTERMRITAGGDLILQSSVAQKSGGGSWAATSDKRVKDSIQNYTKGTAELMQVRVCEWEYNGKAGTTAGMKGIGVIADEVMSVLPATVDTYQAKLNAEDAEPTTIKRFDSSEITWLLVKTVQEQHVLMQEQQATIAALTARMAVLEAK